MSTAKFNIIAGPCSAENRQQVVETARQLSALGITTLRAGVWKPRTHAGGFEGCGALALPWLQEAQRLTGMKTAVEVGTVEHARLALGHGVNILWLGARTVSNPFAVQELADFFSTLEEKPPILVKNPLNPDVDLWVGAVERLQKAGIKDITAVHRGFSVYAPEGVERLFRNEPLWAIPLEFKRRLPEVSVIVDPSHMGGRVEVIEPLCHAAVQMGFDGLMIECHWNPARALTDSQQQITPMELQGLLSRLKWVEKVKEEKDELAPFRENIDEIDAELLSLLARRMEVSSLIGKTKHVKGMQIFQPERYDELMSQRLDLARKYHLSENFVKHLLSLVHEESCRQQMKEMNSMGNK